MNTTAEIAEATEVLLPGEKLERLLGARKDFPEGEEVIAELKQAMSDWDFEEGEHLNDVPRRRIDSYRVAEAAIDASRTLDASVRDQAKAIIAGRIAELRQGA
jgi:hypothetical protein